MDNGPVVYIVLSGQVTCLDSGSKGSGDLVFGDAEVLEMFGEVVLDLKSQVNSARDIQRDANTESHDTIASDELTSKMKPISELFGIQAPIYIQHQYLKSSSNYSIRGQQLVKVEQWW